MLPASLLFHMANSIPVLNMKDFSQPNSLFSGLVIYKTGMPNLLTLAAPVISGAVDLSIFPLMPYEAFKESSLNTGQGKNDSLLMAHLAPALQEGLLRYLSAFTSRLVLSKRALAKRSYRFL